jgi:hypothetical protein
MKLNHRTDPAPPTALDGVVQTDDDRAIGHKPFDHDAKQQPGNSSGTPPGAVEDLVKGRKVGGFCPAGHAQAGRDGPLAWCQQSPHHQNEHMLPTRCCEAGAPCLQPLAQDLGNGVPTIGMGMVQHPMLRIPAGNGGKATAITMRRSESGAP